ncbi:MAG: hypothetical protein CMG64_03565 [Candidatus Marinimicrobia bacterium]|nr:hypothetical protein [Candidatus Neomarinimicrobiota bacterium]
MKRAKYIIIIIVSLLFVALTNRNKSDFFSKIRTLSQIFDLVQDNYVEDVDMDELVEGSIRGMLETLDPHSTFMTSDEFEKIQENMQQEFEGIGIEFSIIDGFITVISPIPGTPSERAGLIGGDQFIKINGESAYKITQEEVFNKLRGPKGTSVDITISRLGVDNFDVTLIRDKIPITSVLASFLYNEDTGYIKVNRFAKKTFNEIKTSIDSLESHGMQNLILDLRSNGGGDMDQALELFDLFINSNDTLLYTKGRIANSNDVFYATRSMYDKDYIPIVILINRSSASASEIIAGGMQDLDRGLVVGETSFGKGLVQRQYPLLDGSAARITIARYYTPSGRLIQRDFEEGLFEYYNDLNTQNREVDDSLTQLKPKFKTKGGREVLGGGGITPDVFIANDEITQDAQKLIFSPKRIIFKYANIIKSKYANLTFEEFFKKNKSIKKDKEFKFDKFKSWFKKTENKEFIILNQDSLEYNWDYISNRIAAEVGKNLWGKDSYYHLSLLNDTQFQEGFKNMSLAEKYLK